MGLLGWAELQHPLVHMGYVAGELIRQLHQLVCALIGAGDRLNLNLHSWHTQ